MFWTSCTAPRGSRTTSAQFPRRVSPMSMLSTCASNEFTTFDPPPNQTCGGYMAEHISAPGGYLQDSRVTGNCQYCKVKETNVYLAAIHADYGGRWRNFSIVWAYVAFNVAAALLSVSQIFHGCRIPDSFFYRSAIGSFFSPSFPPKSVPSFRTENQIPREATKSLAPSLLKIFTFKKSGKMRDIQPTTSPGQANPLASLLTGWVDQGPNDHTYTLLPSRVP